MFVASREILEEGIGLTPEAIMLFSSITKEAIIFESTFFPSSPLSFLPGLLYLLVKQRSITGVS